MNIKLHYDVPGDDFTRAGEASADLKARLKKLGIPADAVRKVAIALYEGEINLAIHAGGGEIVSEFSAAVAQISRPAIAAISSAVRMYVVFFAFIFVSFPARILCRRPRPPKASDRMPAGKATVL